MSNEWTAPQLAEIIEKIDPFTVYQGARLLDAANELRRQHTALQDLQTECAALRVNEENLTAQVESLRAQLAARAPDGWVGCVMVGYAKHHGGWCVLEETAPGEYVKIKGPFDTKELAQEAMRTPAPSQQAPAQECEWTNCPRRVGDVCCNEQQAPVAQGEPVGVVDAVSEQGFHVEFSVPLPVGTKLYTHAQQASEPMTDEQIRAACKQTWVFETARQWVRAVEHHHNIKGKQ